ncbi:MAG: hypothetical protein IKA59_03865 [Clostridia bacterium]|nr:hypothetical protein [Clostridia bacterium]
MKKCSICNSENVRNYPFELGFIPSHILHEDIVLPVNPKFNICMDCGHVFITDTAAVETIKKMDNLSTSVKTEKDKFVAKAKETIATVEAKIKALEEKIIAIEAQLVAKVVESKVKEELTAAKEKLQSELKATEKIKTRLVSAYETIKSKLQTVCTPATPATETVAEAPATDATVDAPATEKTEIINNEAVNGLKDVFNAGKSFLKKAFAKPEANNDTKAE